MATLTNKVMSGGFWITGIKVTEKILNWVRLIILARILAPDDFGKMGIALLAMGLLETFSQTGFNAALIQKKGKTKGFLAAAWTVSAIRGGLLAGGLFSLAPVCANFFGAGDAKFLIQIIALSMLTRGLTNIKVIYYARNLRFKKQFFYILSGSIVDFIVTIVLAIILVNPIALVIGLVAGSFTRMVMSYIIDPWMPRIEFDRKKIGVLFKFGKWILITNLITYLLVQGDAIFVGRFMGSENLGFYQMAFRFASLLSIQFAYVISEVTFPAYSKMQENIPRLKNAYFRVLKFTTLFSVPFAALMFLFAKDFTRIMLGEKWLIMVPVLQVLSLGAVLRLNSEITGVLFRGIGKPKIQTIISIIALLLIAIIIYPMAYYFGIFGTALAVSCPFIIISIIEFIIIRKILGARFKDFLRRLSPPVIATCCMSLIALLLKIQIPMNLFTLILIGCVLIFSYCVFILIYTKLDKTYLSEISKIDLEKISFKMLQWRKKIWT